MTTICLDFGNTRLKLAVFEQDKLQEVFVLKDDGVHDLLQFIQLHNPSKAILSSVIDHNPEIESLLKTS